MGCYNCEGFLSAAAYIASLLRNLDAIFLSETWLSHAEATLLSDVLSTYGVDDIQVFQTFTMDVPPGSGEGRRHGGNAMICKSGGKLMFSQLQSEDPRLLAVRLSVSGTPFIAYRCWMLHALLL